MRETPDELRGVAHLACIASVPPSRRSTTMHATRPQQLIDMRTLSLIAVMALVFAAGTIVGGIVAPDLQAAQGVSVAGDRRYDAVEETRANRGLSVPAGDRRYDAVEETRANSGLSPSAGDRRYDAVEETRADRGID
jgi:hypothetical protein